MDKWEGLTLLDIAAGQGKLDVAKYLVSMGSDPTGGHADTGFTALHYAVDRGRLGVVEWLVASCEGVDVDALDRHGCTALHHAVLAAVPAVPKTDTFDTYEAIASWLVEAGRACTEVENEEGLIPAECRPIGGSHMPGGACPFTIPTCRCSDCAGETPDALD